jgi:hypothetical protein
MCKTTKVKSRRLHSQNRIILIVLTIGETPSGAGYSLYRIFCIMNPDRFQYGTLRKTCYHFQYAESS